MESAAVAADLQQAWPASLGSGSLAPAELEAPRILPWPPKAPGWTVSGQAPNLAWPEGSPLVISGSAYFLSRLRLCLC